MKFPWQRPSPYEPANAPGTTQDNRPRLNDIVATPSMYEGKAVRWSIDIVFDRKTVSVGTLYNEERAKEIVAKMREGLL